MKKTRTNRFIFLAITILLCNYSNFTPTTAHCQQNPERLTFVSANPADTRINQWLVLVYTEALRRMGIEFVFLDVPPKRSTNYTDTGIADGQTSRIYTYNETYTNLVRVEEHVRIIEFYAYSADPESRVKNWDDLKGKGYSVDYRLGVARCEQKLFPVPTGDIVTPTTDINRSIKKLINSRIDFYIDYKDYMIDYFETEEFRIASEGIEVIEAGLLEEIPTHAFLNEKYKHLAPKLATTLRQMKSEKLFEKYRKQVGFTDKDIKW